jgi:hypothetical protein
MATRKATVEFIGDLEVQRQRLLDECETYLAERAARAASESARAAIEARVRKARTKCMALHSNAAGRQFTRTEKDKWNKLMAKADADVLTIRELYVREHQLRRIDEPHD